MRKTLSPHLPMERELKMIETDAKRAIEEESKKQRGKTTDLDGWHVCVCECVREVFGIETNPFHIALYHLSLY